MNDRITVDLAICGGEPRVKGTRTPDHVILDHLAAGEDYESILERISLGSPKKTS